MKLDEQNLEARIARLPDREQDKIQKAYKALAATVASAEESSSPDDELERAVPSAQALRLPLKVSITVTPPGTMSEKAWMRIRDQFPELEIPEAYIAFMTKTEKIFQSWLKKEPTNAATFLMAPARTLMRFCTDQSIDIPKDVLPFLEQQAKQQSKEMQEDSLPAGISLKEVSINFKKAPASKI